MTINKSLFLLCSLTLFISGITTTQATPAPSLAGTSWDLSGKFGGTVIVECGYGLGASSNLPGKKKLKSSIEFVAAEDTPEGEVAYSGTFTWQDDYFAQRIVN